MKNIITKSDKQMLVDWYFSVLASECGQDCEVMVKTDIEEKEPGVYVQNVVAYRPIV